jgi:acetyl-CoA carboxylase biotin carboxyl carrier protein
MTENFITSLVETFNKSAVTELDLNDGTTRLILKKTGTAVNGAGTADDAPALKAPRPDEKTEAVTSPIVATFYAAPGPDAPPFASAGQKLTTGESLCILEAMKMMNHLEAEFDCEIIETHAASGELVEYGQKLFTVRRL